MLVKKLKHLEWRGKLSGLDYSYIRIAAIHALWLQDENKLRDVVYVALAIGELLNSK